jgi:hypothetical protein
MTFLTVVCWIMGLGAAGVVVLWILGCILSVFNDEKRNADLADDYDH